MEETQEQTKSFSLSRAVTGSFIEVFNLLKAAADTNAKAKGFWDKPCSDAEQIALMHSELSEALEYLRHGNPPDDKIPQFKGLEAELADVVIRIMSYAGHRNLRVAEAIVAKMEHNSKRPHMHGGKLF